MREPFQTLRSDRYERIEHNNEQERVLAMKAILKTSMTSMKTSKLCSFNPLMSGFPRKARNCVRVASLLKVTFPQLEARLGILNISGYRERHRTAP